MKFYGELLVFALLFITNLRVFFVHHVRRDPLVVLAPFTFIVAIFQILAWGIDAFTFLGLFIALLVLLSNFHAIFRYLERLYIDHYSPLMRVWAAFTIIISAAALAATIYFAPVESPNAKLGITETKSYYKGNFRGGFEKAGAFTSKNLIISEYSRSTIPSAKAGAVPHLNIPDNVIVVLMPDKRADTAHYLPYLQQLAASGVKVYSADFFADDGKWIHSVGDVKILRRLVLAVHSLVNNQWFMGQREYYTYNITQELNALLPLLEENAKAEKSDRDYRFFLITDVMGNTAASDYQKKNPEQIAGILNLDSFADYKTAGYGCIEQTDPVLALALGTSRDRSLKLPKLLAQKTVEALHDIK